MVGTPVISFFVLLHCILGEGDFFKTHKDTPRGQNMFGSLVVVLPTAHEGGQLVLRQEEKEWTLDFTDKFAAATEPSVYFVAFFGDIEHEVLPVTSGYRVTLTYNLYHKSPHLSMSLIPTPFHLKLKKAFVDLVNDKSILPNGGYFGFGLTHEYVHTGRRMLAQAMGQLKGSDRALVDVCDELGLDYSLRFLYRDIGWSGLNFITTNELDINNPTEYYDEGSCYDYLRSALKGFTIGQAEGVIFVGERNDESVFSEEDGEEWLEKFYENPITEVLEITPMKSSLQTSTSYISYGNEADLVYFYGSACMLVAVAPAEERDYVAL